MDTHFYTLGPVKRLSHALAKAGSFGPRKTFLLTLNAVQMSLLSICASFAKYFSTGKAEPQKDMLLLTNCTLLLTDEEFSEYLSEINQVTVKYMKEESSESSKTRRITLISAPTNE